MSYQTAKTIAEAVRLIERRAYLLPAIQREFVWKREQIEELFDSLMRGYPIGSFLFWEIEDAMNSGYQLYDFIADHDPQTPHNAPATLTTSSSVTAILDGQQRLTAMNIALRGSLSEKVPRLRYSNPNAWVKRRLHLCLLHADEDAAPDEDMYEFRFKSAEEATVDSQSGEHFWMRVADVLHFDPESLDHEAPLKAAGIDGNSTARTNAFKLTQVIHKQPSIAYYLETKNDLDKVLNIFIRVNRGGTKLSYSDLLMSVATAHWQERDARQEVHDLVDQLNAIGGGFSFGRDRVLKASLVLSGIPDIKLKASNMLKHMLTVEANWDAISQSILVAGRLLAQFGLSRDSLTAENVIIPVAYYVHKRHFGDTYLTAPATRDDRERLRSWVIRSLLRAGFWTGAVDTILIESRKVIDASGANEFPMVELEQALEAKNKSLTFTDGEVEELLSTPYQSPRCVPLLTLLYGDAVRRSAFHTDHVYPRSKLPSRELRKALAAAGRPPEAFADWDNSVNLLPNLQLLTAAENMAKGDLLPLDWASTQLDAATRDLRLAEGDLTALPRDAVNFLDWFEARRAGQEARLRKILNVPGTTGGVEEVSEGAADL